MPATRFYGSQIGSASTKPHAYTGSPLELLRHDIAMAFTFILYLPYIVWPLSPMNSKQFCELYPSPENLWAITLHVILVFLQLPFILSVPFWLLFPVWQVGIGFGMFLVVNSSICGLLNGTTIEFPSNPDYAEAKEQHKHEQWIFLNGVAVGSHWLQSNVDRLALTFGRPVLGVHNKTTGILFDVLQCLIQRNFTYATSDVRACYAIIKSTLYKPHLTKVIFILHSQGGIEGGLIIDWLLQEVPQDLLAKLEVYTFGNAANHFNNPHLHLLSQHAATQNPDKPTTMKTITQVHYHEPTSPTSGKAHDAERAVVKRSRSSKQESTSGKTIRYIEHYAHTDDFVAQWGVLHFVPSSAISEAIASPTTSRFMGRVFERQGQGHQMNMHYLDSMFPLKRSTTPKGGIGGSDFDGADEDGDFMSSIIDLTPDTPAAQALAASEEEPREGAELSYQTAHGTPLGEREGVEREQVLLRDFSPTSTFHALRGQLEDQHREAAAAGGRGGGEPAGVGIRRTDSELNREMARVMDGLRFRVRDMSRLWLYVNGKSPKLDEVDVGLARMATI